VAVEQGLRFRAARDLRRAVGISHHGELGRLDLPQRELARKELDAGFLGGKARGQARGAAGTITAVGKLLRGKNLVQRFGGLFRERSLDQRDLHAVDATAGGSRRGCRAEAFHPRGAFGVGGVHRLSTRN
jgi:hypothetical protein